MSNDGVRREIIELTEKYNIPIYFYNNKEDFSNSNKRKSIQPIINNDSAVEEKLYDIDWKMNTYNSNLISLVLSVLTFNDASEKTLKELKDKFMIPDEDYNLLEIRVRLNRENIKKEIYDNKLNESTIMYIEYALKTLGKERDNYTRYIVNKFISDYMRSKAKNIGDFLNKKIVAKNS